jgi:hypothetical protein
MELINHSYVRLIGKDILTKTSKEKRRMTVKKNPRKSITDTMIWGLIFPYY